MSTSRALRRSALYRSCGHVRPRHSRDVDSVVILQRTTHSVAEGGTASGLIIGEGKGGKYPSTTFALCPNIASVQRQLGPTYSVLPLPDACMGRSSSKKTSVSANVSIHSICQYCAIVFSPIHSFQNQVSSLKTLYLQSYTESISGFYRTMHMFLKNWRSKISLEYENKYDGCGPDIQNRAACSEETPPLQ